METKEPLRNEPISKLILKLSAPAIVSLLCNSVNMAIDRMFIAKGVGTLALSAVTVAFGLYLVMQACSQLIGAGASSSIAIQLGKENPQAAEKIIGNAFVLSFLLSIVISTAGLFALDPLLKLYGADSENIIYAKEYASIMFSGALCFVLAQSMNSIVRGMGYAKRAFLNFFTSILINLILDAAFVFVLKWGVKGAALATVIGNLICGILAIQFLCCKRNHIRLRLENMKPVPETVKAIFSIGLSGFIGQFALSIVTVIFNHVCRVYSGNTAVAAYGIISTVFMLVYMPMIGLGQGIQPIIGYNYSSKIYQRVKKTLFKSFQYATIFCILMFLIFEIMCPQIISAFGGTDDPVLFEIAGNGLRIYGLMTPIVGVQMIGSNFFQYIGKAKQSMFLSALRQMLLLIPLVLVLPLFFKLTGVWAATPIADGISFIITALFIKNEICILNRASETGTI